MKNRLVVWIWPFMAAPRKWVTAAHDIILPATTGRNRSAERVFPPVPDSTEIATNLLPQRADTGNPGGRRMPDQSIHVPELRKQAKSLSPRFIPDYTDYLIN